MWKIALTYGAGLAALALLMAWFNFRLMVHSWSVQVYGVSVALVFAGIGVWLGNRFTPRLRSAVFVPNEKARTYLAITNRELQVLELLAEGHPNKIIARQLAISPNTVKTHTARLFEKLGVANRTQAIRKGRELALIP